MGSTQSRPPSPRPPRPVVDSDTSAEAQEVGGDNSRPRLASRLSSFGRSSMRKRRRSGLRENSGSAKRSDKDRGDGHQEDRRFVDELTRRISASDERDGRDVRDEHARPQTPLQSSTWATPSLPTSPGPPVLQATSATARDESYFPPFPEPSAIEQLIAGSSTRHLTSDSAPIASPASAPPITDPPRTRTPPRPTHTRGRSLPGPSSSSDRTMTGRLTALLGVSGGDNEGPASPAPRASSLPISPLASTPSPSPGTATTSQTSAPTSDLNEDDEARIAHLRAELSRARQEVETHRRDLETHRRELESLEQEMAQIQQRVPVGAMLVIQGLAQTESQPTEDVAEDTGASSPGWSSLRGGASQPGTPVSERPPPPMSPSSPSLATAARRPRVLRRMSDGSLFRRRREQERERGAALSQQARMIAGLLTVAAAATANSLLQQQEPPAPPPRAGVGGAIDALLNRLRPNRSARQGIEQALGSYLRNVVRDNRRTSGHARLSLPPLASPGGTQTPAMQPEFEGFLQTLQDDLMVAVRTFANTRVEEDDSVGTTSIAESNSPVSPLAATAPLEAIRSDDSGERRAGTLEETSAGSQEARESTPADPAVPFFHRQLGQITRQQEPDRFGVSGGEGQPRSLNFFRAHLFPAIPNTGNPQIQNIDEDPSAIVPCIFVGVRSIRHDPNMTTEDLVHHPGFPFSDGNVPPTPTEQDAAQTPASMSASPFSPSSREDESYFDYEPAAATNPASPPTLSFSPPPPDTPPADSSRPPLPRVASGPARSFRDRVLARLSRRAQADRPMNTYLVYVIGGNYPRDHPVLRIPNLLTGGPLTDEELQLVSELLGPARPPTASKDDIEQAGLRIVDGGEMRTLGEKGEVMDNCVDRCLICLGDYEHGEECRVLGCKHGYHRECVDTWLEKGANSCPACRNQAVEKTTRTSTVPPPTDTESALAASGLTNPLVAPTGPLTLAPERDQGAGPAMTSTTLGSASGASGFQAESLPSLSPPIPVSSVPAGDSGFNEGWVGGMPMSGSRSGSGNRDRTSNEDLD